MDDLRKQWLEAAEAPRDPMEFLARSWSVSALEVSKALARKKHPVVPATAEPGAAPPPIPEDSAGEVEDLPVVTGNSFTFATSATSQLYLERILSQSEVSPLASGRLSHSSGPLIGEHNSRSLSDGSPISPSDIDDLKYCGKVNGSAAAAVEAQNRGGGSLGVGRRLQDGRARKKEARVHNAQLHAAVSVAGVAAAVAAIAAATAAVSSVGRDDRAAPMDLAVASAATLVAAQCVEVAEAMGAERDHLAAVVGSSVSVRNPGDVATLTAAAATALRGAATLKARALKVWNVEAVIPVEKGGGRGMVSHHNRDLSHLSLENGLLHQKKSSSNDGNGGELALEEDENFLGLCSQEFLARGTELLKRTRSGVLHWKIVSVYINRTGQVMLKMKSRHVAGAITKKKKSVVIEVCKDIPAWPGRHLLEGGERRRYFGLITAERRVIEFECQSEREFEMWTQGVSQMLNIAREKKRPTAT